jgi:hypothetical protein
MTTRILTLSLALLAGAGSAAAAAPVPQSATKPATLAQATTKPSTPTQATTKPAATTKPTTPAQATPPATTKTPPAPTTTQATPPATTKAPPTTPTTQATPPPKGATPAKATPAKAPVKKKKPARMKFINFDAGAQMNPSKVSTSLTYKLYGEDARFDATYDTGVVPIFGVRAGINLRKRMMVGVGGSLFTSTKGVVVKAQLPHPFFFQKTRSVDGVAPGIDRNEAAIYAEVGWLKPWTKKMDVMFFGGPALFHVTQSIVTRIQADDRYPYDDAAFVGADSLNVSKWVPGVTVGLDLGYLVRKKFRVGGLVRYSYGSAKATPLEGQSFNLPLGGLQTSLGVRFRF